MTSHTSSVKRFSENFDQEAVTYRKVASSSLSRLVAHFQTFRRLMKGKSNAYVVWPLAKKFQNWMVDQSTARDFTGNGKIFIMDTGDYRGTLYVKSYHMT